MHPGILPAASFVCSRSLRTSLCGCYRVHDCGFIDSPRRTRCPSYGRMRWFAALGFVPLSSWQQGKRARQMGACDAVSTCSLLETVSIFPHVTAQAAAFAARLIGTRVSSLPPDLSPSPAPNPRPGFRTPRSSSPARPTFPSAVFPPQRASPHRETEDEPHYYPLLCTLFLARKSANPQPRRQFPSLCPA
ncbi:hypothetical protein B0J12DRAFT_188666 [Macrophomina phaseolina]|uniref:Uncharacterized protein n=1 Tax=Macrophomina phaseolina TaxID=35725 RepID=A0ABQ8G407_9PEZI|nr:hypothetical protein B0J12DRAFT_188666 [Macrophomina phaseolina]